MPQKEELIRKPQEQRKISGDFPAKIENSANQKTEEQ